MRFHSHVTPNSFRCYFGYTSVSLRCHFDVISIPLQCFFDLYVEFTPMPFRCNLGFISISLRVHFKLTSFSRCGAFDVASRSLISLRLILRWRLVSLRLHFGSTLGLTSLPHWSIFEFASVTSLQVSFTSLWVQFKFVLVSLLVHSKFSWRSLRALVELA